MPDQPSQQSGATYCVAVANGRSITGPTFQSFSSLSDAVAWIKDEVVRELRAETIGDDEAAKNLDSSIESVNDDYVTADGDHYWFNGPAGRYGIFACESEQVQPVATLPQQQQQAPGQAQFTPEQRSLVIDACNEGCDACDAELGDVLIRLVNSLEQTLIDNDEKIKKWKAKITRKINREQAQCENLIEKIATNVSNVVNNEAYTCQVLLTDLRDKVGAFQPPAPPQPPTATATATIDLSPLVDCCKALIEVLREIRDRLPGVPVEYPTFEKPQEQAPELPEYVYTARDSETEPEPLVNGTEPGEEVVVAWEPDEPIATGSA